MGANVLVEFKNVFLIGGIFLQWEAYFLKVGGNKLFWDRENQLFWDFIWTPVLYGFIFVLFTFYIDLG